MGGAQFDYLGGNIVRYNYPWGVKFSYAQMDTSYYLIHLIRSALNRSGMEHLIITYSRHSILLHVYSFRACRPCCCWFNPNNKQNLPHARIFANKRVIDFGYLYLPNRGLPFPKGCAYLFQA